MWNSSVSRDMELRHVRILNTDMVEGDKFNVQKMAFLFGGKNGALCIASIIETQPDVTCFHCNPLATLYGENKESAAVRDILYLDEMKMIIALNSVNEIYFFKLQRDEKDYKTEFNSYFKFERIYEVLQENGSAYKEPERIMSFKLINKLHTDSKDPGKTFSHILMVGTNHRLVAFILGFTTENIELTGQPSYGIVGFVQLNNITEYVMMDPVQETFGLFDLTMTMDPLGNIDDTQMISLQGPELSPMVRKRSIHSDNTWMEWNIYKIAQPEESDDLDFDNNTAAAAPADRKPSVLESIEEKHVSSTSSSSMVMADAQRESLGLAQSVTGADNGNAESMAVGEGAAMPVEGMAAVAIPALDKDSEAMAVEHGEPESMALNDMNALSSSEEMMKSSGMMDADGKPIMDSMATTTDANDAGSHQSFLSRMFGGTRKNSNASNTNESKVDALADPNVPVAVDTVDPNPATMVPGEMESSSQVVEGPVTQEGEQPMANPASGGMMMGGTPVPIVDNANAVVPQEEKAETMMVAPLPAVVAQDNNKPLVEPLGAAVAANGHRSESVATTFGTMTEKRNERARTLFANGPITVAKRYVRNKGYFEKAVRKVHYF
jgi:hypothetical protein